MTVVECSCVPGSRPAVLGSGNTPARPAIPPAGPGLTGPDRICATSGCPAVASAAAARAASALGSSPGWPASPRSTATAWRMARSTVAASIPRGSRCTTATAASSGKPNSRVASLSAWAAAEPGGIRLDRFADEVALSGGRNTMAAATAAAHPPTMKYRRPTTTNAYPRASRPAAGRCDAEGSGPGGCAGDAMRLAPTPDRADYRPAVPPAPSIAAARLTTGSRPGFRLAGSAALRQGLREVVDGLAAHGLLGEVGRHPLGDGRRALAAAEALAALAHVVVHLMIGHEFLERRQRGPRVGPVEPADSHHRVVRCQLQRRRLLRALGGRDPLIAGCVLLEQLHQRAAHLRITAESARTADAAARATAAAESAGPAAEAPGARSSARPRSRRAAAGAAGSGAARPGAACSGPADAAAAGPAGGSRTAGPADRAWATTCAAAELARRPAGETAPGPAAKPAAKRIRLRPGARDRPGVRGVDRVQRVSGRPGQPGDHRQPHRQQD